MMGRVLKIAAGVGLVVAGVFMLVLPGPGIVAILAGLYLIASQFPRGREHVDRLKRLYDRWREERDRTRSGF